MSERFSNKVAVVTGGNSGIAFFTIQKAVPLLSAAVLFLSSAESGFIVGTELVIDGGMIQL